jgi:hypothetical protein
LSCRDGNGMRSNPTPRSTAHSTKQPTNTWSQIVKWVEPQH